MKPPRLITFLVLGCFFLALAACDQLTQTPAPVDESVVFTSAAQTILARQTLTAGETAVAQLTLIAGAAQSPTPPPDENLSPTPAPILPSLTSAPPSPTPVPPSPTPVPPTATPTPTLVPTSTPTPTTPPTSTSTSTPVPTPTPTPLPCDWAQFVADVTIVDGSTFAPGIDVVKTWRIRNIGSCTWNDRYDLVYVSGARMDAPAAVDFTGTVRPGETVDISVSLVTPDTPGTYVGYFQLRNAAGVHFGIGADAENPIWVRLTVAPRTYQPVFLFVEDYCDAEWRNSFSGLSCPGGDADLTVGFVYRVERPYMETGVRDDEPALVTHPDNQSSTEGRNGMITGRFEPFLVRSGDRFRTVIGCLYDQHDCNVAFQLRARYGDGSIRDLGTWNEIYDQSLTNVDLDLSDLAGSTVEFILSVNSNGDALEDYAFWLLPRIVR